MENTTLLIECPYDNNLITVYLKHSSKFNPIKNLCQDDVVLFENVYRKITQGIDIICQIYMKSKEDLNIQVIGRIDRHSYTFAENPWRSISIADLPSSAIIRKRVCVNVSIVDIHYVKVRYLCEICKKPIENSRKCSQG
jgi:hypothetical protein